MLGFDLCDLDLSSLTLPFCMNITCLIGNISWKFHDTTMLGTWWKRCHRRTDWTIHIAAWSQLKSALQWHHTGHDSFSNHQPHDCLLNRLFRRRSKKASKLRVTGLCAGNSPGTGEFPAQMASNAENVSIWWRHHGAISSEDNDLSCNHCMGLGLSLDP